ncbi:hypothetical protein CRG98_010481 [Punica granatum]|uniref:CCHC-type domain-containing protein n=1 Tax=Punica granatum TaxID=22663 RepID=A0A2I0KMS6_PUNGR|nr:hypothetical protein CRG98_010481 [Punica granatum]
MAIAKGRGWTRSRSILCLHYSSVLRTIRDQCELKERYSQGNAQRREVEKLHQFLMGLDAKIYGPTVSQIVNTEPLPTVNKAFQMVNQEEKRKVPLQRDDRVDVAAFSAGSSTGKKSGETPYCDYCHKTGHWKSTCRQLHRYPTNWDPKKDLALKTRGGLVRAPLPLALGTEDKCAGSKV